MDGRPKIIRSGSCFVLPWVLFLYMQTGIEAKIRLHVASQPPWEILAASVICLLSPTLPPWKGLNKYLLNEWMHWTIGEHPAMSTQLWSPINVCGLLTRGLGGKYFAQQGLINLWYQILCVGKFEKDAETSGARGNVKPEATREERGWRAEAGR